MMKHCIQEIKDKFGDEEAEDLRIITSSYYYIHAVSLYRIVLYRIIDSSSRNVCIVWNQKYKMWLKSNRLSFICWTEHLVSRSGMKNRKDTGVNWVFWVFLLDERSFWEKEELLLLNLPGLKKAYYCKRFSSFLVNEMERSRENYVIGFMNGLLIFSIALGQLPLQ